MARRGKAGPGKAGQGSYTERWWIVRGVNVGLQGVSALLMHRFPEEPIAGLEKKSKGEQAEAGAYRHPKTNELYVPAVAVQRSLVNAAVYSKGKGRASLQKVAAACLIVSPEYLLLGAKKFKVDSRPVVIPATKGRIMRHRPRLDEWAITFLLEYDEVLLSEEQVRRVVDDAGQRVGLLDFRPERKGPFGRFMVSKWEAVK